MSASAAQHRSGALDRIDTALGRIEAFLCLWVAAWLVGSLSLWVALKGLTSSLSFRVLFGAAVLGAVAWGASSRLPLKARRVATLLAVLAGALFAPLWKDLGASWGANTLNWLQDGSTLTLLGGLRGLATRLTLVLALLGGALATAEGRHVTIDLVSRSLPLKWRKPTTLLGGLFASVVCLSSAWGFIDHVGVDTFAGSTEASMSQRLHQVSQGVRRHFFFLRRQMVMDVTVAPSVLSGEPWDSIVTGEHWNQWLQNGDWSEFFDADVVEGLKEQATQKRSPLIVTPSEAPRGLLAKSLNLLVPWGLMWIALRFLIWALRGAPAAGEHAASGHSSRWSLPVLGLSPALSGVFLGPIAALLVFGALIGTPLFAVMGGAAELMWLHSGAPLRYLAPKVLDEQFAGSPVLVTIPLFTLLGYLLAESKAPERIVSAARALLGWLPGGLSVVCLIASAFFTTLTGGSGVTIVAIGGLLLPTLLQQKYPEKFSMGLITTGGSLGLLFPPSLAILVYALVSGLDFTLAFKAGIMPGLLVLGALVAYSIWVGLREKVAREPFDVGVVGKSLWALKWELGVPLLILVSMGTGLAGLDESAGLAVLYVAIYEFVIHRDLRPRLDAVRLIQRSMALSGAVILILLMANALMNWVIQEQIPMHVLDALTSLGLTARWQFLIALNLFLLVVGMVMDGFSAILVAVPLVLPFAARFGLNPFHLAMMFILNLELAFCMPPLGLNLFIAAFRFQKPLSSVYRSAMPFVGVLAVCLVVVMAFPALSSFAVQPDIEKLRTAAISRGEPPREAWLLECVQADPLAPKPCSEAERLQFAPPDDNQDDDEGGDDSLFEEMMGKSDGGQ